MASCVKCTLVDRLAEVREPIGVCSICSSLACHEHGTLLQRADCFMCYFCLPRSFLDSSGLRVVHEVIDRPPDSGGGGTGTPEAPRPPDDGGPDSGVMPEFLPGELEELYEDLAAVTREHREIWREDIGGIVEGAAGFAGSAEAREQRRRYLPSLPEAVQVMERVGDGVSRALVEAVETGDLNEELLADGLGIATWALGEKPGSTPSADRIKLLSDARVRYFVRFYVPVREIA